MELSMVWLQGATRETLVVKGCRGRIDHEVSDAFKDTVSAQAQGRTERVVVDLCDVEFIDSAGLAAMICLLKRLGSAGEIILCGLTRNVRNFLWLTHMDRVFTIRATIDDAVDGLTVSHRKRVTA